MSKMDLDGFEIEFAAAESFLEVLCGHGGVETYMVHDSIA